MESISQMLLDTGVSGCRSAIVPAVDYHLALTNGSYCAFEAIGQALFHSTGGWVTNFNATVCVQRSIEYALHRLQVNLPPQA